MPEDFYKCAACKKRHPAFESAMKCCLDILNYAPKGEPHSSKPPPNIFQIDDYKTRCFLCSRIFPYGWKARSEGGKIVCLSNCAVKQGSQLERAQRVFIRMD